MSLRCLDCPIQLHRTSLCPPNYGARNHPCSQEPTCKLSVAGNPKIAAERASFYHAAGTRGHKRFRTPAGELPLASETRRETGIVPVGSPSITENKPSERRATKTARASRCGYESSRLGQIVPEPTRIRISSIGCPATATAVRSGNRFQRRPSIF